MSIWKCASGGYHSEKSCQEEFKSWNAKFNTATINDAQDVQLVRVVERHELAAHLDNIGKPVDADTIDAVLRGLIELTPDGKDKKSWEKLHRRST